MIEDNWFNSAIQLRYTDLDAQGHVNNIVFVEFMQQARVQFMESGPARETLLDEGTVIVDHKINYFAPISFSSDPLRVDLGASHIGGAKFEVDYRIIQGNRLCATARSSLCPFDFYNQRPRRLTGKEKDFLKSWQVNKQNFKKLPLVHLGECGHRTLVQPRWSDTDHYGHINNVRQMDYLMLGRIDMTASADPTMARLGMSAARRALQQGEDQDLLWVIARQDVQYHNQAKYRPQPYEVATAPVAIGEKSVTLAAELVDPRTGVVISRSQTVLVAVCDDGHAVVFPQAARTAMEKRLVS